MTSLTRRATDVVTTVTGSTLMLWLLTPPGRSDPYAVYRRLRSLGPLHIPPFGLWVITGYDDASTVLRHPAISSEGHSKLFERFFDGEVESLRRTLLFRDPPDHTRLRALVDKALTVRGVEELRPRIQAIADELVDAVAERGRMELLEDFSYPLPTTVICEWLGVPVEDRAKFALWMRALAERFNIQPALLLWRQGRVRRGQDAARSLGLYFTDLVEERRLRPRDDFLSALIAAEEQGSRLSATELVAMAVLLLLGGHETVANLIANGLFALLRHPDQLERLRADPTLVKSAVEELLRYETSVHMAVRAAAGDIALDKVTIRRGETVLVVLAAANRDPKRFVDPHRLDVGRHPNPHLGFAAGIHYCLGAPLARLEAQIALSTLIRRLPGLRLDTAAPRWRDTIAFRGLQSLPLAFDSTIPAEPQGQSTRATPGRSQKSA